LLKAIEAVIKPVDETLGVGTFEKHYQEAAVSFFDNKWLANTIIQFASDVTTSPESTEKRILTPSFESNKLRIRYGIPRNMARNAHLLPQLTINSGGPWKINSMSLDFSPVSEKGAK
jgi:hypothetical protein